MINIIRTDDGIYIPDLIEILPSGQERVVRNPEPTAEPSEEQRNYLTDDWKTVQIPGWTTYQGLPCVAWRAAIESLHAPNPKATELWKAQNPKATALHGVVVIYVADYSEAQREEIERAAKSQATGRRLSPEELAAAAATMGLPVSRK
jgi:hypothetical protein